MGWGIDQYELVRIPIKRPCKGYYLRWYYNGWHYFFFLPGRYTLITEGEKYRTIGTRQISMSSGQQNRGNIAAIRTIMNTREVYLLTIAGWMNIRIEPGSVNIYNNIVAGEELEFIAVIGSKEISYATGYTPVPGDGSVPEIPVVPPSTTYCEVVIGDQVWMCRNFDSNYPASRVYDDNEYYRAIYGGLYMYDQVMSQGFAPVGWHVPTLTEWQTLLTFLGGSGLAGGKLKEIGTDHWDAPNTGAVDTYGFSALGGGRYNVVSKVYELLKGNGYFWTATQLSGAYALAVKMDYDTDNATPTGMLRYDALSVRLIKDIGPPAFDDWFLPSLDELREMKTELYDEGVGGFSVGNYYTSTELSATYAYGWAFGSGDDSDWHKSDLLRVRACRSFTAGVGAYSLRDTGPAGGLIYHISGGTTYYEAAVNDISLTAWSNITNLLIGTTGTAIGTGAANTLAIIGQAGHINSAANECNNYTG